MTTVSHYLFLFLFFIFGAFSSSVKAQNNPDACTTCKTFCGLFASPLSFSALSSAMTAVDEYCDEVKNPTRYDDSLCQKYSSIKVSFINNFSIKNPSMTSLCGSTPPCKEECPSSTADATPLAETKKKDCEP